MKIILSNKKEYDVIESSTIERVTILVDNYAEVDNLAKAFTKENLKRVILNESVYERIYPLSVKTESSEDRIAVTFINRKETFEEKILIQLGDLQETVLALSEGGAE